MSITREEYLEKATNIINKLIFNPVGYDVPSDVRVSCSWAGGGANNTKTLGQCWPRGLSNAGVNEIFISPMIEDSVRALDVLVHELIHAIDDCKHGHRKEFTTIMRAVGLEGKPTATHAGDVLRMQLSTIVEKIGPYPHAALNYEGRKGKQKNRHNKCSCSGCGATWRMSAKWQELVKVCPVCTGTDLEID